MRAEMIRRVIGKLKPAFRLENALDTGCGVGFFSKTLEECGLLVCGFDGRAENLAEARRRFPQLLNCCSKPRIFKTRAFCSSGVSIWFYAAACCITSRIRC